MERSLYLEIRKRHPFKRKSSRLWLHLGLDASLIVSGFLLAASGYPWIWSPLMAILMFRNFGLMHDAVHAAVHDVKWINEVIGIYSGAIALLPFELWRKSHLQHHFWSGNVEKDPVMALRSSLPRLPLIWRRFLNLSWTAWIPTLGLLQNVLFWKLSLVSAKEDLRLKTVMSIVVPIVSWGILLSLLPISWILSTLAPGLFLYFLLTEAVNLPHHLQMPTVTADRRFNLWDQHRTARTCLYPKWFATLVTLNFNYHAEHHMYPDAPWYYLDEVQREIAPLIGDEYHQDENMSWILENRSMPLLEVINKEGQTVKNKGPNAA